MSVDTLLARLTADRDRLRAERDAMHFRALRAERLLEAERLRTESVRRELAAAVFQMSEWEAIIEDIQTELRQ